MISQFALNSMLALLLPLAIGSVWTCWLLRFAERRHPGLILGYGYLVGIFLVTLILRVWHFLELPLTFGPLAATVASLSIFGAILLLRQSAPNTRHPESSPTPGWQWAIVFFLIALIGFRYHTIIQEIVLRPLYPWDTWMNWAPKAIVWFHHKDLVPFVGANTWLISPPEELAYTEGARNAWKYPIAVPLVQLWTMIAIDSSDATVIYLPWAFIALALGAALYGQLRLLGKSRLVAVIAVYLLLNLPFLNVHSALAGYADLWVAVYFCCSIMCIREWERDHSWPYLVLAVVMAAFCVQLKIPGTVMAGIAILTLASTFIDYRKKGWYFAVPVTLALVLMAMNLEFSIEGFGEFVLSFERIKVPYIGNFEIAFHPVHGAILDSLFMMINWNLLWYLVAPVAIILVIRRGQLTSFKTELISTSLTLGFIFFVYFFTPRYAFAEDFTQFNRAMLYAIPLLLFAGFSLTPSSQIPGKKND